MLNKIVKNLLEGKLLQTTFRYIGILFKKGSKYLKKCWKKGIKAVDFRLSAPFRNSYVKKQEIVPNRIVFSAVDNRYDCNPKYITEEIIRRNLPYEIVWVQKCSEKKGAQGYPEQVRVVNRDSKDAIDALATAKVWIENELKFLKPYTVHKKPGQYYLQTWHGSMGFKKIGRAHQANQKGRFLRNVTIVSKRCDDTTDYCISNSAFETNVFREAYWSKAPILEYGHARNDILLTQDEEQLRQVKEKVLTVCGVMPEMPKYFEDLPEEEQQEILKKREDAMETNYILYAPTYRPGGSLQYFDIDFAGVVAAMRKRFGGKWKVILRYHLHNRKLGQKRKNDAMFINATSYPDMQELLAVADVGITDYSSWLCDYVLTKRPAFIYAVDYDDYAKDRGLYYPLDTTPFPIARDNAMLEEAILSFDAEKYQSECEAFLEDKGCVEQGTAAKRIVDKLEELIG